MKKLLLLVALMLAPLPAFAQKFGFFPLSATPNLCVNFFDTDGASIDPTGTPTVDIYEEDTATEIINDQNMAKFDAKTGYYCYKPTLSSGNGFEVGRRYAATVSAVVDGITVTSFEFMTFQMVAGTAGYFPPDWSAINAPTTTVNLSGTTVKTATDIATSLASSLAVRKQTAFEWPLKFLQAGTQTPLGSGVTPSCTRSIDSHNTFVATTNTASTTTTLGFSELTLSTTDTNGDYYLILRCTATGADPYETIFKIQVP